MAHWKYQTPLRGCLHVGSQSITCQTSLQVRFSWMRFQVGLVEIPEETQLPLLRFAPQVWRRLQIEDARRLRSHQSALIDRWQRSIGPVFAPQKRQTSRVCQGYIGRQLLSLTPKSVQQPTAKNGTTTTVLSCCHGIIGRQMVVHTGMHGIGSR